MKQKLIKNKDQGLQMQGIVTIRAYKAGTKELVSVTRQKNLIMVGTNTGKDLLVQWLLSAYNASNIGLGINYGAIGTGSTAPNVADTQLTAETNRVVVGYGANLTHNEVQLQFFFTDSMLTTGTTYREFGTFVGGSAGANTGNLFNHALLTPAYTKAAGTDTTIECDISFT